MTSAAPSPFGARQLVAAGIEAVHAGLVGHRAAGRSPRCAVAGPSALLRRDADGRGREQWLPVDKSDGHAQTGRDPWELPKVRD